MTEERKTQKEAQQESGDLSRHIAQWEAMEADWRRTEQALRESERRLSTLLSNLPGMAYRCRNDAEWTMEFVSEGCLALTGHPRSEVIQNRVVSWNELIHPDDRQAVWAEVQRAIRENRSFQMIYRIRPIGGKEKWVSEKGVGVFDQDGQLQALEGFIADITERVEAEESLRSAYSEMEQRVRIRTIELARSESQSRGLIEACPDAVLTSDLEGRVQFASQQTWHLLGLPADYALKGRSVLEYVAEEDRPRLSENMVQLVQTGMRKGTEYRVLRSDMTTVAVEVSSSVIRNPEGQATAIMAIIRDITDRKKAQEALRQRLEELQRERRTLEHMLRASDHERRVIAYDIHDGLAQHLAASIMQFQTYGHLMGLQPEKARTAYDAGIQMLQQAHFEARRLISGVRPPILDESGIVAAIAHLVHEQTMPNGPRIEFHSAVAFGRLSSILEDTLYRVAQEALSNACQHSRSKTVRLSLVEKAQQIVLEVQDRGIGFNPEGLADEHFGLEGIRERARLLGGQVEIKSEPGSGTLVRLTLPRLSSE